ncbi:MAG TPA: hypothetical protein VNT32_11855 [Thermoleophilaceae bacterium]|nr:hypothetical protein [Thermoleophilaceae bacterium]
MNDRALLRLSAAGRIVIGLGFMLAPGRVGAAWIGKRAADRGTQIFVRATGARDVALGIGTLWALGRPGSLKPWLYGAAIADLTDAAATLAAGDAIPEAARNSAVAVAGSAAAGDVVLAARLG